MFKATTIAILFLGACASDGKDGTDGNNGTDGTNGSGGQLAGPAVYTLANQAGNHGSLTTQPALSGMPAGASGLVAR